MPRHRTRATLDAGARLTLAGLGNVLRPMTARRIIWTFGALEVCGELRLSPETGILTLCYEGREQHIDLIARPRHFGGLQWYFRCPVTQARASVLWKPLGATRFACRLAFPRMLYHSQSISPLDRAWRAKRRVARKLGSEDPADHDMQTRPKWMRKRTYARLAARYEGAHRNLMRDFDAKAPALFEKLGITPG
jgi:hypothetical protein